MFRLTLLAALCGCLFAGVSARAQDVKRIDDDKAKEVAKLLLDASAKLELPIKVSLDAKKGAGLHASKSIVFVLPDSKLTAEVLKKIDRDIVPLGVLYTTANITLLPAEQPVAADQHHVVKVTGKTETVNVNVLTLAATKVADRLVLLVYAKDKKPAVVAELAELEEKSDHTIDIDARPVGKNRAVVVLNVLGRYKAAVHLAAQAQE